MSAPGLAVPADNSRNPAHWRTLLRDATIEVFAMMVRAEISESTSPASVHSADVTGMVGMAGALCGVMTVRCTRDSATRIASQMLDVPVTEAAVHRSDAIGEICNMVAGNFKAKIEGMQDKCMLSVPTVITGEDYQFHSLNVGEQIQLAFDYHGDTLWILLELRS